MRYLISIKPGNGYVACNYTEGDTIHDVEHGPVRRTIAEASADQG